MGLPAITSTLDPRAYLDRIRYGGAIDFTGPEPSGELLRALHAAHMLAVPFENLSIHYGQPILLDDAALYDKIVRRLRGGFCYELNGLFAWLLRRLGYTVTLLSARVAEADGSFSPEFDHLTLRVSGLDGVDWDDVDWLADVGFGDSFRAPLRLEPDREQDGGDGHIYRLRLEGAGQDWLMEREGAAGWRPQYRFTLTPHGMADFAPRCLFQQTSLESHFTQKRLCSLALPDGRATLSDLRLITTRRGVREERDLASEDEYRATLAALFGVTLD